MIISCCCCRFGHSGCLCSCSYSESGSESTCKAGSSALFFDSVLVWCSHFLLGLLTCKFAKGSNTLLGRSIAKMHKTRNATTRAGLSVFRSTSCVLTSCFSFTRIKWRRKFIICRLGMGCCRSEVMATVKVSTCLYIIK